MINEYKAFVDAFQKGKMIKSAVQAKNFQLLGNSVAGLLTALLIISQGLGYHIPVDSQTVQSIGAGIGSIWFMVNAVITVVTTDKIGVKRRG